MKRVRGKSLISIALILTIATFAAANMRVQAGTPPPDHVRVYIWNPATASNYYPTKLNPQKTAVQVWIDSPASWYNTNAGIVGVTATLRVDPNIVEIMTALQMPDADFYGQPDSFLGDFLEDNYYYVSLGFPFIIDKPNGVALVSNGILSYPTIPGGAGDGPKPLWRVRIQTNASVADYTTAYSALTLGDAYYTTYDGVQHPIEIVDNGHYGTPPPQFYMNLVGSMLPPGDPRGTQWHELYPNYSHMWSLDSWIDNGDGDLTASDQIDMTNETGWNFDFHVDVVTVTIHYTFKDGPWDGSEGAAEAPVSADLDIWDPIGTTWHEVYPEYSREFVIRSHIDQGAPGFDASDQFDFEYFGEGVIVNAHLDSVSTDIILSQKGDPTPPPIPEFPLGLGLMIAMAPAIPIVYLWRSRKKVVVK